MEVCVSKCIDVINIIEGRKVCLDVSSLGWGVGLCEREEGAIIIILIILEGTHQHDILLKRCMAHRCLNHLQRSTTCYLEDVSTVITPEA